METKTRTNGETETLSLSLPNKEESKVEKWVLGQKPSFSLTFVIGRVGRRGHALEVIVF